MTNFILHGGGSKQWNEKERLENYQNITRILTSGFKTTVKVLLVYYARMPEFWDEKLSEDKINFSKQVIGIESELVVADTDPNAFEKQVNDSDIIFVRGGDTKLLMKVMSRLSNFKDLIKNKKYFGSSAGAYAISEYYYSNDRHQIEEGLGVLPVKCFAHWDGSQIKELELLKNYKEDLPIETLKEGEYKVFEI
ncbi:MAG: Type 1 glutamine amidotransferase-like domain-containing protein [Patescibacteria group bacterium]|nr:Type 1 glutamine amidotransferase-like domain-containing protein [Patescibacteria group bacterium]